MRGQVGDVQIADINRLLSREKLAASEVGDPAGGVEMELRVTGVKREPIFWRPRGITRIGPCMGGKGGHRNRVDVVVFLRGRREQKLLQFVAHAPVDSVVVSLGYGSQWMVGPADFAVRN